MRGACDSAPTVSCEGIRHFDEAIAKMVAAVPEESSSPFDKVPLILPVRLKRTVNFSWH